MRALIVGAGMAGLACAERLRQAGHDVTLLDKGRGAGGRMATRRIQTDLGEASFDHGAQYFSASDSRFESLIQYWRDEGKVAHWPAAGQGAWVGFPAMNSPLKAMAEPLDVRWSTRVTKISRNQAEWDVVTDNAGVLSCDVVVAALPVEQVAQLLDSVAPNWAALARAGVSSPCWTVMLVFSEPLHGAPDCLRNEDDAVLGWAARNSAKPGRTGPEAWVLQAGSVWSSKHLEAPQAQVEADLSAALSDALGTTLPKVIAQSSHRWRYARPDFVEAGPLWDPGLRLGICGDWLAAPNVEGAWLSGVILGDDIKACGLC